MVDWMLIENLQIEPSWIELIETYISQMSDP